MSPTGTLPKLSLPWLTAGTAELLSARAFEKLPDPRLDVTGVLEMLLDTTLRPGLGVFRARAELDVAEFPLTLLAGPADADVVNTSFEDRAGFGM